MQDFTAFEVESLIPPKRQVRRQASSKRLVVFVGVLTLLAFAAVIWAHTQPHASTVGHSNKLADTAPVLKQCATRIRQAFDQYQTSGDLMDISHLLSRGTVWRLNGKVVPFSVLRTYKMTAPNSRVIQPGNRYRVTKKNDEKIEFMFGDKIWLLANTRTCRITRVSVRVPEQQTKLQVLRDVAPYPSIASCATHPTIKGGEGFIELGAFRLGCLHATYFVISSATQAIVPALFLSDGSQSFASRRHVFTLKDKPLLATPTAVTVTDYGVVFHDSRFEWCLGMSDLTHLSLSVRKIHATDTGRIAALWDVDGNFVAGTRSSNAAKSCFNGVVKNKDKMGTGKYNGFNFIQWGEQFRMGQVVADRLSVAGTKVGTVFANTLGLDNFQIGPLDMYGWPSTGNCD